MIDLSLQPGNRAFLAGYSGSGKTTLALAICSVLPCPLVVIDTKDDPSIEAWARRSGVRRVWRMPEWSAIDADVVVVPPASMLARPAEIDQWLGGAFSCRWVPSIYIDEGYQVGATSSRVGEGVSAIWSRGRSRGMIAMLGAQRPRWISRSVPTQSDVLFGGALPDRADRQALADVTGVPEMALRLPRYAFRYLRQDGSQPRVIKLVDISPIRDVVGMEKSRRKMRRRSMLSRWLHPG